MSGRNYGKKTRKKTRQMISAAKINAGLTRVGKKYKVANTHRLLFQRLNKVNADIKMLNAKQKRNPEKSNEERLEDLIYQKILLEAQLGPWIKAKKPITVAKFTKFVSEKCSTDEARLPVFGDITFKNCILKGLRFFHSIPEVRQIRDSIPTLDINDYRIILLNGHGAIEGGLVITGEMQNDPTVKQSSNRKITIEQLPKDIWYFSQGYPGTSTIMCKKVDARQFQNLNSPQKRNGFVRRLFSDGTFHTFLEGKSYDESDTAMVGIPTMPFHNKAWDFGQWEEHGTVMGIYDITDPNFSFNIDPTRQVGLDGHFVYKTNPTQKQSRSPSDELRNQLYYSGTIAGNGKKEPSTRQFHYPRLQKIRELIATFKTNHNGRDPNDDELKILTKDETFPFTLYSITENYPLDKFAANRKFKRVYNNILFASDWSSPRYFQRDDGKKILFDPIAAGADGVSVRQRMIDTMAAKRDIVLADILKWFDPNAPGAIDKRKVIFLDWSCQPISTRVQFNNGPIQGLDFNTKYGANTPPEKIPALLGFQAAKIAFEKMARELTLTFHRIQSLFEETNGPGPTGASPYTAKVELDDVTTSDLAGKATRTAMEPMDVEEENTPPPKQETSDDWAPPFGGRRRKKRTRRKKRKRRKRRKTRRKK